MSDYEKYGKPQGLTESEWERDKAAGEEWTLPPEERRKRDRRKAVFMMLFFVAYPLYLFYEWFTENFMYIGP